MSYRKIILILCLGIFLSAGRSANAQSKAIFNYISNATQTWTVPGCVSQVTVQLWGGGGGCGNYYGIYDDDEGNAGGSGAYYEGVLSGLVSGEVLTIYAPSGGGWGAAGQEISNSYTGGGTPGWPGGGNGGTTEVYSYGGGGGGYAAISINGTYYVVAAGGGGGGGYGFYNNNGGFGGGEVGGQLGDESGDQGGYDCCYTQAGGASLTAGGTAGQMLYSCGDSAGRKLHGGWGGGVTGGCDPEFGGGGGGGGWYGGGGGGDYIMGGGGGSSYPDYKTGLVANGITFKCIVNPNGTDGVLAQAYNAPNAPSPTIGQGGWLANGGNGEVIINFTSDTITSLQTTAVTNVLCNGTATGVATVGVNKVAGSSAFTYLWQPGGQTNDTAKGLFAGTYTVTVIGCVTASATVTISQPAFFGAAPTINQIQCNGGTGSIFAGATGGTAPYTYLFTPGGQVPSISNLGVGTYDLNVIDSKGCATSEQITISQPARLTMSASIVDSVVCNGQSNGSATTNVNGGTYPYAYSWSPSGGNNASATGLAGGTYVVTATDSHGCTVNSSVNIYQPKALNVLLTPPLLNLRCNGDNNGVLGSGVTGGTRPYAYFWSNNLGTDSNASGLAAGTYTLTVTDVHHCSTVVSSTITQPSPLIVTIDTTFNSGSCNGTAWITLNGGTQPYGYAWSNGSSTYYQNGLCNGLYCCTVTDANGCFKNICGHVTSDLGVDNVTAGSGKITIYPNPNNGMFTIQSSVGNGKLTVEVYNVLGEEIYSQANVESSTLNINLSNQPNGVYLYRVMSSENGNLLGEGKVIFAK